jgi:hypothetical protein
MLGRQSPLRCNLRTSARIQVIPLIRSSANFRYDSQAQGYVYPISVTESSLPTIQIAIGDPNGAGEKAFDIMPRDLGFAEASPGWVYGGFQDRGPSMNFDILGDVFLKNLYAVWFPSDDGS